MDALLEELTGRWEAMATHFEWPEPGASAVRDEVLDRYREPHRHYHTLVHVLSVLETLDALAAPGEPSAAARLAVWFHDVVYEGKAGDDEEASARLVEHRLAALGTDASTIAAVGVMVRATAGHFDAGTAIDPASDTALVLDADLSILAAEPDAYDRYVQQVRAEYAHVPDDRFAFGRRAAVAALLGREQLFLTAAGRSQLDRPARENLARELGFWDGSTGRV